MTSDPILIQIATPGVDSHNKAQLVALSQLQEDLQAAGFDVDLPIENRGAWLPSPDQIQTLVELWIVQRGGRRLIGKALDDAADAVYDKAKSWAKRQLAKRRKPDDLPRQTLKVIIYGPDDKPLKTIEVPDDSDDEREQ
jgi:hypothetical protein